MANPMPINATAGAVPVRNEKGELRMEKVKVSRYVAGKRPEYAVDDDDDDDEFLLHVEDEAEENEVVEMGVEEDDEAEADRRLRRLKERRRLMEEEEEEEEERIRHRVREPEIILKADEMEKMEESEKEESEKEEDDDDEVDEEEIERRRMMLRQKVQEQRENEAADLLAIEEEEEEKPGKEEEEEEESSEYEDSSDYEEDMTMRLKPVFIRRSDRVTVEERSVIEESKGRLQENAKLAAKQRKNESLKLVEEVVRKELQEEQGAAQTVDAVNTDDENEEDAFEGWKVRELRRIKRDREERDKADKEKEELERLHQMTDEQREQEFKDRPKIVTNAKTKGKMKFLQKYYHRGVFYLDDDDEVFKRDFAQPTLEDHFDKTILPKVMQVKNFGLAGRTKYTHLVDQDTSVARLIARILINLFRLFEFDAPWGGGPTMNAKTAAAGEGASGNGGPAPTHRGGTKQNFTRPSAAKKRKT